MNSTTASAPPTLIDRIGISADICRTMNQLIIDRNVEIKDETLTIAAAQIADNLDRIFNLIEEAKAGHE